MTTPEPDAGDQPEPEQLEADEVIADDVRRQWDDQYWSRSPTPQYRP